VDCPDDVKFTLVEKVKTAFKKRDYETVDLDGRRAREVQRRLGPRPRLEHAAHLVMRGSKPIPKKVWRRIEEEVREVLMQEGGFTFETGAGGH